MGLVSFGCVNTECNRQKVNGNVAQTISDLQKAGVAVPMMPIKFSPDKNLTSDTFVHSKDLNNNSVAQVISDLREAGVAVPMMPIKYSPKA